MKASMKSDRLLWLCLAMIVWAADAAAVSPRQLVEVADLGGPVVSPDGRLVAYRVEQASIERNTYDTAWYVVGLEDGSPPRRLADGGVPLRNSSGVPLAAHAIWSPDSRWIFYRALIEGRIAVWRAAVDGSVVAAVTLEPADVRAFSLAEDGATLRYSVGATREQVIDAEQAEYDAGIRIDATIPVGQGLFRSGYLDERLATQRLKDNEVIRYPLLAGVPDRWMSVDLASGHTRPSQTPDAANGQRMPLAARGTPWRVSHAPDGTRVAVLSRIGDQGELRDAPDVELAVVDHARVASRIACVLPACSGAGITGIQWRPQRNEVIFTVTDPEEGYAQSIFRWDIDGDAVHEVVTGHGLLAGGRDRSSACGASLEALACVTADPSSPPKLERIDLDTGKRRTLHDPNAALAWDMATRPVKLLRWTDAEGNLYTGQFFAPRGGVREPVPLVISYYWCLGYVRGGLGDEMPFASLADAGVAALCINRAPIRVDAVQRYELARSAVESAVDHLAAKGIVARDKVGMGGLSFGSEATLWTAMYSDILAAASVSSPMLSPQLRLLLGLQGDAFEQRLDAYWQLGNLDQADTGWQTMSPVFNLERFKAPLLMQMSEQEYIHVLDYAVPLIRAGKADMYVFPHEPHQKFQPRHKLAVYERNLDWFRFWLQRSEDADPRKAQQYEYWRVMRSAQCKLGAETSDISWDCRADK